MVGLAAGEAELFEDARDVGLDVRSLRYGRSAMPIGRRRFLVAVRA
jgi:hypothetical protein